MNAHSPACTWSARGGPCPNGCHDAILWDPANAGVELVTDLLEMVANEDMPEFEARRDLVSGKDGLDEVAETAMLLMLDAQV